MTRRLIAILLMLWFPVQGWAALAMPFCQHASNAVKTAAILSPAMLSPSAVKADADCLHHGGGASMANVQTAADSAVDVAQCDHCAACHLAHTPMLTPLPFSVPCAAPAQRAESAAAFYYQFFLEQPQRPPLSLV